MRNSSFKLFLSQNIHIVQWVKLLLLGLGILFGGILISYLDHQVNYPTDEEIAMYTDISYSIWDDGLRAGSFNNYEIQNYSKTYSNNELFSTGLKNADLGNINMNLQFDSFTLENNFSTGFLIKPNTITNVHLNIYPSEGITQIYSDYNFIKSNLGLILKIFMCLTFVVIIYITCEYLKFTKKLNS